MKISLKWLQDYIDLSDISPAKLENLLTMAGLEVETMEDLSGKLQGFVVAHVQEHTKHPNADKLSVCKIFDGTEVRQVVCGAPNVAAGQKVVLALPGTIIPSNGMTIGKAKLRGVESTGMLCSERELELSEDHSGIMVLDENAVPGTPIADYMNRNDVIFEIGITPNRPDALSHYGVARDLSALLNRELKLSPYGRFEQWFTKDFIEASEVHNHASVEVLDFAKCPRYSALVVKGITIKESPAWLRNRLESIGSRSINNIVDITNFILHDIGQPLHAFDLDKLDGAKIIVKTMGTEGKFTTLDSKERTMHKDALMICDAGRPVAVAGVMGGENSEVSSETKNVLIESAYFNPGSIRKTAKSLTLSTDASYRFERGTDPGNTLFAALRAASLMAEAGEGIVVPGVIDVKEHDIELIQVTVRFARVNSILGYEVSSAQVLDIVTKLGFIVQAKTENDVTVLVPSFRPDIDREIDVIEEIARIFGYDNIPAISSIQVPMIPITDATEGLDKLRTFFTGSGFYEIISNSLVNKHIPGLENSAIQLMNPQSSDMSALRTSLVTGLLTAVQRNISVGERNLKLFETGHVFRMLSDMITDFSDIREEEVLGAVFTGHAVEKEWYTKEIRNFDIYDVKASIINLLDKFHLSKEAVFVYTPEGNSYLDQQISVQFGTEVLITAGRLKREVIKAFDIEQEVFYLEVGVEKIKELLFRKPTFTELVKFPKMYRDFAFVFDKMVNAGDVELFIRQNSSQILRDVRVFDIFESEQLGAAKKSMAFSLEFFDEARTLTDDEVETVFSTLINKIKDNFQAVLRG
ncbi:MAG: phenylalanine--tRNA ligase subunit beta [Ignavibacteria bacterium]|nr:phenylalanine--tRNA ligase subunit beta [Ignavibacteria bacterium]